MNLNLFILRERCDNLRNASGVQRSIQTRHNVISPFRSKDDNLHK